MQACDDEPASRVRMVSDGSERLARRIAGDLGMQDWLWVEEAVRRRHRIIFARLDDVSAAEYDAVCESVDADLHGDGA